MDFGLKLLPVSLVSQLFLHPVGLVLPPGPSPPFPPFSLSEARAVAPPGGFILAWASIGACLYQYLALSKSPSLFSHVQVAGYGTGGGEVFPGHR